MLSITTSLCTLKPKKRGLLKMAVLYMGDLCEPQQGKAAVGHNHNVVCAVIFRR